MKVAVVQTIGVQVAARADWPPSRRAARRLVHHAARRYDSGERADLEAGMAKLVASETAMEIALRTRR